jgi:hypothetical protein
MFLLELQNTNSSVDLCRIFLLHFASIAVIIEGTFGTTDFVAVAPRADEHAFKLRANFTDMIPFDEKYSFSFASLRMFHLKNACNRSEPVNTHWIESICFRDENQKELEKVEIYTSVSTGGCAMVSSYYYNNATTFGNSLK